MIPYSVFLKANPLNPEDNAKAYAAAQVNQTLTTEDFITHVSKHNTVFSKGTIKGVLADVAVCLREQLLNGNKIILDGFGTLGFTLKCEGAETLEKFTANNIRDINVIFTPGLELTNLIDDATFEPVTPRNVQAAALKAVKKNEKSIDLENLKKQV